MSLHDYDEKTVNVAVRSTAISAKSIKEMPIETDIAVVRNITIDELPQGDGISLLNIAACLDYANPQINPNHNYNICLQFAGYSTDNTCTWCANINFSANELFLQVWESVLVKLDSLERTSIIFINAIFMIRERSIIDHTRR